MYTTTLATMLFGAAVIATDAMSGSSYMMMDGSSMTSCTKSMAMGGHGHQEGGMMNTMTTSMSAMIYGTSSMLSTTTTTSMTTPTTSAVVATQQNNAASCTDQATNMGMGMSNQPVMIVQVSDVNGTSLKYIPENIVAPVGSIVQFQFHPKNHTVTESSFADPCKPLAKNLTTPQRPGQKSGFVPVTTMDTDMKVYNMLINDTKPIWIYCGQVGHCQKGMVMVINQNATDSVKTLENYKAAAMALAVAGASSSGSAPSASYSYGAGAGTSTSAYGATTSVTPTSTTSITKATVTASSTISASGVQQASTLSNGIPAVFTGAAVPRSGSFQYAGIAGLAVAGVGALL